jgi:hypothetical protein
MMISIYTYYAAMRITLSIVHKRRKKNPFSKYISQLEREGLAFHHFMVTEDTP